jgi:hypothetical protein
MTDETIFAAALERLDSAERAVFLDEALRRRLTCAPGLSPRHDAERPPMGDSDHE